MSWGVGVQARDFAADVEGSGPRLALNSVVASVAPVQSKAAETG